MTATMTCPYCRTENVGDHCDKVQCGWWECRRCGARGNSDNHIPGARRKRAA